MGDRKLLGAGRAGMLYAVFASTLFSRKLETTQVPQTKRLLDPCLLDWSQYCAKKRVVLSELFGTRFENTLPKSHAPRRLWPLCIDNAEAERA